MPLLLFPSPETTPVLLVVPVLWLLSWTVNRAFVIQTPLNGVILLMAVMVLVSTWATYDLTISLPKISGMVLGFGVYFAVARQGQRFGGWWASLTVFMLAGLGAALLGLLGSQWTISKFSILNPITEQLPEAGVSLQGAEAGIHPNEVSGTLTWVLPMFIALSVASLYRLCPFRAQDAGRSAGKRWDLWGRWVLMIFLWLSTLFVFGVFVITQSRSGYIGLLVTGFAGLIVLLPSRGRRVVLCSLVLVSFFVGLYIHQVGWDAVQRWYLSHRLVVGRGLSLRSFEGRIEIWSRAIFGLQDFAFTGMGMNTFRYVVNVLYPLFYTSSGDLGHAHNEFLQVGLDLGIPGLIAFLALYIGSFWMLSRVWQWATNLEECACFSLGRSTKVVILGLGGGLLAHLAFGMTDAVALGAKPGFLFWMLLGLISSLYAQSVEAIRQR